MIRLPVWRQSSRASLVAAAMLSALAASACSDDKSDRDPPDLDASAAGEGPEFIDNDVAVAWNQIAFDTIVAHDAFDDFAIDLRAMTMTSLAVHDALNSILPVYGRYALGGQLDPLAHPTAAVAQAAHDVLVAIYPDQADNLDAELATWLDQVPDGPGKTAGIELGQDAAAANIAERDGDGMDEFGEYAPDAGLTPGKYQFVPPFDFVFRPAFGDAEPFGLNNSTQFRPGPSPSLPTPAYADDYIEVKEKGILDGSTRSDDESHQAQWWYEPSEMGWNRIANQLVRERDLHLYPAARAFALMNMGLLDAYVAVWNAKRHYDAWRPLTAIQAGDADNNDATEPDAAWEPFCVTPPTWEYPSAHAMQSAAAADMLVHAFGADDISFTSSSTTAPAGEPDRSFTSLRAAADEAGNSRVMCGIHFRFAVDAGLDAGRQAAQFIINKELEPLDTPAP